MNIEEALNRKDILTLLDSLREILRMLRSKRKDKRDIAWKCINFIVESGNSNKLEKYRGYLRSLLWNSYQSIRDDAWKNLNVYKAINVKGIERALKANSDKIKWSAWSNVLELINLGLVERSIVISVRNSYWRLLKSRYSTIRKKAWRMFVTLVKEGIFYSTEDKERFLNFLKYRKANVRIYAWRVALELTNTGFISKEELKAYGKYLEELTFRKSKIKKLAEKLIKDLT